MKLYIAKNILEQLKSINSNIKLTGTFDKDNEIVTVVNVVNENDATKDRKIVATFEKRTSEIPIIITNNNGKLIFQSNIDDKRVEVIAYEKEDFFKRTPFNSKLTNHLSKQKVLVIGIGSVGAPMACELAKSGVGKIIAVDKDILEIHNCMRHVLGTSYIGWPKPIAFARYLKEQVPMCECVPVFDDIFNDGREKLKELIEKEQPTHILAVTDSLRVQYLCQMAAALYKIPLMAVWADNNAIEGEIFFWEPNKDDSGCYSCMRPPENIGKTRSKHFDYSSDDPDTYGGEPALGTMINKINDVASIMMIAWMLRSAPEKSKLADSLKHLDHGAQYVRLGGPYLLEDENYIKAKKTWEVRWCKVLHNESCEVCGKNADPASKLFNQINIDTTSNNEEYYDVS